MNVGEGFSLTYMFLTNMHFSPAYFTNIRTALSAKKVSLATQHVPKQFFQCQPSKIYTLLAGSLVSPKTVV